MIIYLKGERSMEFYDGGDDGFFDDGFDEFGDDSFDDFLIFMAARKSIKIQII